MFLELKVEECFCGRCRFGAVGCSNWLRG